ncbi:MAG: transcription antitermination factor NusB [Thiothrix sp.]|nr:transcription antitermination factor NusB [Thiothrix sp.]HPQ97435.1 transcription antitermination factor NusB [Thiolinea sp.]
MRNRSPNEQQQFISRRRVARRLAMIGVYQWLVTANSFQDIYQYFQQDMELAEDFRKCDAAFCHQLMRCGIENAELPGLIEPFLDRKLVHVDMIEHAVLRVASCELFNHPETPYKVIVNEYVNLSKKFGADQAHKFINGVLDKVAAQTRPQEFKPRHTDRNRDTV